MCSSWASTCRGSSGRREPSGAQTTIQQYCTNTELESIQPCDDSDSIDFTNLGVVELLLPTVHVLLGYLTDGHILGHSCHHHPSGSFRRPRNEIPGGGGFRFGG